MDKIATLIDNKISDTKQPIKYDTLEIEVQKLEGESPKDYLLFKLHRREDIFYPLDEIALEDNLGNKIGNQAATKIFTINDPHDSDKLKDALANFGIPPNGVRIGGKRKRKTRKSKRPRKSKKSKRKTNRKKI